jgi:hypothetical protein
MNCQWAILVHMNDNMVVENDSAVAAVEASFQRPSQPSTRDTAAFMSRHCSRQSALHPLAPACRVSQIPYGQKIETAENAGVPCSGATLPRVVSNDGFGMILPHQNGVSGRERAARGTRYCSLQPPRTFDASPSSSAVPHHRYRPLA